MPDILYQYPHRRNVSQERLRNIQTIAPAPRLVKKKARTGRIRQKTRRPPLRPTRFREAMSVWETDHVFLRQGLQPYCRVSLQAQGVTKLIASIFHRSEFAVESKR